MTDRMAEFHGVRSEGGVRHPNRRSGLAIRAADQSLKGSGPELPPGARAFMAGSPGHEHRLILSMAVGRFHVKFYDLFFLVMWQTESRPCLTCTLYPILPRHLFVTFSLSVKPEMLSFPCRAQRGAEECQGMRTVRPASWVFAVVCCRGWAVAPLRSGGPYGDRMPLASRAVVLPCRTNVISDRGDAAVVGDDDISG
ncbi:hypothetical protein ADL21_10185 [Streptomyces albus subsp. albus]|nr:hypothetical protein ADL21_10185 [Streptomyces albus subsp. albus]